MPSRMPAELIHHDIDRNEDQDRDTENGVHSALSHLIAKEIEVAVEYVAQLLDHLIFCKRIVSRYPNVPNEASRAKHQKAGDHTAHKKPRAAAVAVQKRRKPTRLGKLYRNSLLGAPLLQSSRGVKGHRKANAAVFRAKEIGVANTIAKAKV